MDTTVVEHHRHGPDRILRAVTWVILASWVLCLTVFLLIAFIRAPYSGFVYEDMRIRFMEGEGLSMMDVVLMLMTVQMILGITGLVIQARRMRRTTDHYSVALLLFTLASFAGLVFYSQLY
jgi:hypothetical protein